MIKEGYSEVYALEGGWTAWLEGGYPIAEKDDAELPVASVASSEGRGGELG